jgi:hypothetical protein
MALFAGSGQDLPETGRPLAKLPNTAVVDACDCARGWLALAVVPLVGEPLPDDIEALPLPYAIPERAPGEPEA